MKPQKIGIVKTEAFDLIEEIEKYSKEVAEEIQALIVTAKLLGHKIELRKSGEIVPLQISIHMDDKGTIHLLLFMKDNVYTMSLIIYGNDIIKQMYKTEMKVHSHEINMPEMINTIEKISRII